MPTSSPDVERSTINFTVQPLNIPGASPQTSARRISDPHAHSMHRAELKKKWKSPQHEKRVLGRPPLGPDKSLPTVVTSPDRRHSLFKPSHPEEYKPEKKAPLPDFGPLKIEKKKKPSYKRKMF